MTVIRKSAPPFRRLSSASINAPVVREDAPPVAAPDTDQGNVSRANAGAARTGFTCAQCVTWFPQGTQHVCRRAAAAIQSADAKAAAPMTAEEQRLLAEAGQA